eukprot:928886-Rhodomonas_salina.1
MHTKSLAWTLPGCTSAAKSKTRRHLLKIAGIMQKDRSEPISKGKQPPLRNRPNPRKLKIDGTKPQFWNLSTPCAQNVGSVCLISPCAPSKAQIQAVLGMIIPPIFLFNNRSCLRF